MEHSSVKTWLKAHWLTLLILLGQALGRTLAAEVRAEEGVPPFDRSTVAGFVHGYLEAVEDGVAADEVCGRAFAMAMACGAATAWRAAQLWRGH